MTDGHDLTEFLKDRDRILMAAWTLPNEGALTDAQRRQAMSNFADYIRRRGLNYADVGRSVGTPRATLIRDLTNGNYQEKGQIVAGYREGADEHIRTLNNWTEQHARQQAVKLKGKFVSTSVAQDIINVARLVRENQTMAVVFGPSGVGKTRCADALLETIAGAILITVIFGFYHPKGLTSAFAEKLGVRTARCTKDAQQHLSQFERVIAALKGSGRLLIIDEAHKLNNDAVELLREIHDMTECPILCLATKDLNDRVDRTADPDRGQIKSRFDIQWPLVQGRDVRMGGKNKPLFTVEEIKKLYEQTPIRLSADAARYLQDVANFLGQGSLRRCRILLVNAARRARKRMGVGEEESVTVTADDLAYADDHLRPSIQDRQLTQERHRVAVATA